MHAWYGTLGVFGCFSTDDIRLWMVGVFFKEGNELGGRKRLENVWRYPDLLR